MKNVLEIFLPLTSLAVLIGTVILLMSSTLAAGEDARGREWQCRLQSGCTATHPIKGTQAFRQGDTVSSPWKVDESEGWQPINPDVPPWTR